MLLEILYRRHLWKSKRARALGHWGDDVSWFGWAEYYLVIIVNYKRRQHVIHSVYTQRTFYRNTRCLKWLGDGFLFNKGRESIDGRQNYLYSRTHNSACVCVCDASGGIQDCSYILSPKYERWGAVSFMGITAGHLCRRCRHHKENGEGFQMLLMAVLMPILLWLIPDKHFFFFFKFFLGECVSQGRRQRRATNCGTAPLCAPNEANRWWLLLFICWLAIAKLVGRQHTTMVWQGGCKRACGCGWDIEAPLLAMSSTCSIFVLSHFSPLWVGNVPQTTGERNS